MYHEYILSLLSKLKCEKTHKKKEKKIQTQKKNPFSLSHSRFTLSSPFFLYKWLLFFSFLFPLLSRLPFFFSSSCFRFLPSIYPFQMPTLLSLFFSRPPSALDCHPFYKAIMAWVVLHGATRSMALACPTGRIWHAGRDVGSMQTG